MIKRYSRKELTNIWEEKNKYRIWLDIELAATEVMEKIDSIPKGITKAVKSKAKINVKRIHKIEDKVKHDVIAFLTSILWILLTLILALDLIAFATPLGIRLIFSIPSAAANSISSQILYLFFSSQILVNSFLEYLLIMMSKEVE